MTLQAIRYDRDRKTLFILDQLQLPHQETYKDIRTVNDAFCAIRSMAVRGAPAIAIVGALSLAVELDHVRESFTSAEAVVDHVNKQLHHLVLSRPTAVNLSKACHALKSLTADSSATAAQLIDRIIEAAEQMLEDDVKNNTNIGHNGSAWIQKELLLKSQEKISALTICNTGSLATAGYGTALGIIRSLYADKVLQHAYCLETRPYNQGSRLTAYELVYDKIPGTLITDSMASALLKTHPEVKLVVVGADRVARNGDTANKIGTYQLAIVAKHHGVKFIVAAPTTTIDLDTPSGDKIVIEQRPPYELTAVTGPSIEGGTMDLDRICTISTAAPGIGVWNPAFDVTPKDLIDAIVTEKGVAVKNEHGEFELETFFN